MRDQRIVVAPNMITAQAKAVPIPTVIPWMLYPLPREYRQL